MVKNLKLIPLVLFALNAKATSSYPEILKSLTSNKKYVVSSIPSVDLLMSAGTLEYAGQLIKDSSYENIVGSTQAVSSSTPANQADNQEQIPEEVLKLIKKNKITFVIVPGLLGEFIETRAFEEIFSKDSSYRKEWKKLSDSNQAKDKRYKLKDNKEVEDDLSNLIEAASVDDANGSPLFKMIILKTNLGSLESVGKNTEVAQKFNRRLQKYFDLTKDKNMVLVGYSRGTPLALEMMVQARNNKLTYLESVKALTSYAGVIMGSSLADDTEKQDSKTGNILKAAKELSENLKESKNEFERIPTAVLNKLELDKFVAVLSQNSDNDPKAFSKSLSLGDSQTVAKLVQNVTAELGLGYETLDDFNGHVARTKKFINEILVSVDELKSESLKQWWSLSTNVLPKKIRYLSLAAAMVDPEKSDVEKEIYDTKTGYNDTLDDAGLQKNRKQYETITGVALNDSQVAIHQCVFLPKVIESLNPSNSGMKIELLGLLETHHWGVSLQVVNKMKDGRMNPYPREQVLWALAAYLNQEQSK